MRKHFIKASSLLLIPILISSVILEVSAHPGRTDGSGGHRNSSSGEYHYHHGYSAHRHYDMDGDGDLDCPYNFDDQTSSNSGNASGSSGYSSPSRVVTVYEDREVIKGVHVMPAWSKLAMVILAISIFALFIANRRKKSDIIKLENQIEQQKDTAKKIESENQLLIAENNELQSDLNSVISAIDIGTPYFPKNVQLDFSLYKIDIPDDIYFTENNIPIKGTSSENNPYGDYTVFLNKKSEIYHIKRDCGNAYNLQPFHLFEILGKKRPCQRCVKEPCTELPKWYKQLMELCNRLINNQ